MSAVPSGAAGAAGALGPASAALAIGFGVLGFAQAKRQNKFLRRQAQFVRESATAAFKALGKQLTQIRTQALDNALRISTDAQIEAGRAEAGFGGVSGVSVSTIVASFASDVASDTAVIQRNRDAMVDAVEAQKQDVFREASNQITQIGSQLNNHVIAGILAGLGGGQERARVERRRGGVGAGRRQGRARGGPGADEAGEGAGGGPGAGGRWPDR